MTPRFEIVEGRRHHCGQMARAMRRGHLTLLALAGADPHKELRACFGQSAFCKAWTIDGRLAALGGVIGTLANGDGMVWLALSEAATRFPLAVIAEARQQLDALMVSKRQLRTTILDGDDVSLRFAIFLGFHVVGTGWGRAVNTRPGRRLLVREIAANAEVRVMVENIAMIPMEYRPEAD